MNRLSKFLCWIGSHSWRDGPGYPCTECGKPDTLWHFESEDGKWIDECVNCRHTKWWCDENPNNK